MPEIPLVTPTDAVSVNEIGSIHGQDMSNAAHFLFIKNVNDRMATETALLANPLIKKAAEGLTAAFKEEDACYARAQKSAITDDIKEADAKRDRVFSSYRKTLKGFFEGPIEEQVTAAETLLIALSSYHIDPSMQLERETGAIINLVDDCEKKYAAEVQKLGLKGHIEVLKEANNKVEKWLTERSDNMPEKLGALRTARRASDAAYLYLVRVINAYAVVDPALNTAPFIAHMNKVIRRYKTQVIGSKKKKDDDDKPKDPKDPKQPKDPKPTPNPKPGDGDDIHQPEEPPKKPDTGGGDDIHLPEEPPKKPDDTKQPEGH